MALERPWATGIFCLLLVGASYFCYNALGSDLLPAMDEGGFILDYIAPPGSSLADTNRLLNQVQKILQTRRKWRTRRAAPVSNSG